jgi:Zn-dependent protease/predicted transcriptional regulator
MRWSWQVARVNGAPVEIHWLFGLLLAWTAFVGWSQSQWLGVVYTTGLMLATFGCILLHEIGHTVEAQAIGLPVRRIVLLPIGGLAQLAHMPEHAIDELRIALAGPIVNAALALLSGGMLILWLQGSGSPLPSWQRLEYEITRGQPSGLHFWATLTFVNVGLLALNLLPAFPLDGGRILRSALALLLPRPLATRILVRTGWLLGASCLLLATSAGRIWGEPTAITLLITGITAIVGAGAEESFQHNQAALHAIPVRQAVRQPTWILQPGEALTPSLLQAIDSLNRPALPVVSDTRLVGLITRRDLASARARSGALTVSGLMRSDFARVEADADLWRAQQLMLGADQDALPVTEGERLLGLLTTADIRAAFVATPRAIPGEAPQLISPSTPCP